MRFLLGERAKLSRCGGGGGGGGAAAAAAAAAVVVVVATKCGRANDN